MLEHDLSLTHLGSDSVPAFTKFVAAFLIRAVCHLWPRMRRGMSSIRLRQPAATRKFSLPLASTMLVRQPRKTERNSFNRSLLLLLESLPLKMKHVLLLVACTLGRLGLGVLSVLRHGIPRHLQISLSANILRNVGSVLTDSDINDETPWRN